MALPGALQSFVQNQNNPDARNIVDIIVSSIIGAAAGLTIHTRMELIFNSLNPFLLSLLYYSDLCVFRWNQGQFPILPVQPDNDGGNQDNLVFNFGVPLAEPGEWDDENMNEKMWYICQYKKGEKFTS